MSSPIVITGMHRSGTTLVTRQLQGHGVFTGAHVDPNQEDFFFLKRNEWLMRQAGGSWDAPACTLDFLARPNQLEAIGKRLARDIRSVRFAGFMGLGSYLVNRGRFHSQALWGWKDPRLVFTMPAWRLAFPNAHLLYISRNGVDVAASLRERDRQRLANLLSPAPHPTLVERLGNACHGIEFHARHLHSASEFTLQSGFDLWEQYVAQGECLLEDHRGPKLALRFEDLAANCDTALSQLASFANLSDPEAFIASWKDTVQPDRAHAFLGDPELRAFFGEVQGSHWMRKLGYSVLMGGSTSSI
ncbi:MAG: hypothetical protein GY930_15380 [bacterium]|nr:hypothetical protein [bacterium]